MTTEILNKLSKNVDAPTRRKGIVRGKTGYEAKILE